MSHNWEGGLKRVQRVGNKNVTTVCPRSRVCVFQSLSKSNGIMGIQVWVHQNLSIPKPSGTKGIDEESYQLFQKKDK